MFKLYKRGPVWWVRINGQRISTRQTDRVAAETVARDLERSSVDPSYAAQNEATLGHALTLLLEDLVRRGRSSATVALNRQKGGHLVRLLPERLRALDARAVDLYIATREREGAAPLTITKELGALRQALKLAARRGEFARTIESVMPASYSPAYSPRRRWLPPDELAALLRVLPPKRAAHVAWIVGTASRWGESLRARREDVDLEGATVRIRGTKTEASADTIPLVEIFRPLVEFALRHAPGRRDGVLFEPWSNARRDLHVYCTGHLPLPGGALGDRYIADPAGIDPVTPNDLRRTHAKWLRHEGVEPHLIAAMLRHTSTRMVEQVYGRIDPGPLGEQIAKKLGVPSVYRAPGDDSSGETPETEKPAETGAASGVRTPGLRFTKPGVESYREALFSALSALEGAGGVPSVYRAHRRTLRGLLAETGGKG